jgi:peptide subunit release factor 1 (eRF1)
MTDNAIFAGHITGPLVDLLQRDRLIGIVLVRLGNYAVGVYRGETRVRSKVGTGLVHGRHRQGGSSAARFRRHREKQIEQFLIRVCEKTGEYLGPYFDTLDHALFGGAWTTIEMLLKQCPLLRRLEDRALPPLLDIPDPKQAILEATVRRLWSSRVIEWEEGDNPRMTLPVLPGPYSPTGSRRPAEFPLTSPPPSPS